MKAARRTAGVALAAAAATVVTLGVAAPARATDVFLFGAGVSGRTVQVSIPVRITGVVTATFHGDPGGPCAGSDVCGYSGTLSWAPPTRGELDVLTNTLHGRRRTLFVSLIPGDQFFGPPGSGSVDVTRTQVTWTPPGSADAGSAAPGSRCADALSGDGGLFDAFSPPRHGRVSPSALLLGSASLQTRCAGPASIDLERALATSALPLSRLVRGRMRIELPRSRSFTSHGFSVQIDSTLALTLGRPHRSVQNSGSGGGGTPAPHRHDVEADFRARIAGLVTETATGDSGPAQCAPVGSCGTVALSTLSIRATTTASLFVDAPARRPLRDLLAALGLGRGNAKGLLAGGFAEWGRGASLLAQVQQGSLTECSDSAGGIGADLELVARRGMLIAALVPTEPGPSRPTRCPGPLPSADPPAPLAVGRVALGELRHRTVVIRLDRGQRSSDDGYAITTRPQLTLTLTRTRVFESSPQPSSGVSASSGASVVTIIQRRAAG